MLIGCQINQEQIGESENTGNDLDLAVDQPEERVYPATRKPDRIVLTWSGDPKTTQSVTWRTSDEVTSAYAQVADDNGTPPILPEDDLDFSVSDDLEGFQNVKTLSAVTEPLDWLGTIDHYHRAMFTGLEPGQSYLYRVGDGERWSEWNRFRTEPRENGPFSFIYMGDAQNNILDYWSSTVRASYTHYPDARFMTMAGDLMLSNGGDYSWGEWFESCGWICASRPILPSTGNSDHLRLDNPEADQRMVFPQWRANFTLPENGPDVLQDYTYYVDYQNARIISLYSNFESIRPGREILLDFETKVTPEIVTQQTAWLRSVLEENPKDWTIVVFHHPVFGSREDRENPGVQEQWRSLFAEYEVDLVLQGHDHTYARGRDSGLVAELGEDRSGPVYAISNSGGKMRPLDRTGEAHDWVDVLAENIQLFQYIEIDGDTLTYRSHISNGELMDEFRIIRDEKPFNRFEEKRPDHHKQYRASF